MKNKLGEGLVRNVRISGFKDNIGQQNYPLITLFKDINIKQGGETVT